MTDDLAASVRELDLARHDALPADVADGSARARRRFGEPRAVNEPMREAVEGPIKPQEQPFHSCRSHLARAAFLLLTEQADLCLDVESTCIDRNDLRYIGLADITRRDLAFGYPNETIEWPVVLLQWRRVRRASLRKRDYIILERGESDFQGMGVLRGDRWAVGEVGWALVEIDSYRSFVRPTWNPRLSEFCTKLTGITQGDVDAAPTLPEVLADFEERFVRKHALFTSENQTLWVSDGPWDLRDHFSKSLFLSPCERLPRYLSLPLRVLDIRKLTPLFLDRHGLRRSRGSLTLRELTTVLGLEPQGRDHSGIDDARNVARALARMVEIGQSMPQVSSDGSRKRMRWCLRDNLFIDRPAKYGWMGKGGVCEWTDPGVDLDL